MCMYWCIGDVGGVGGKWVGELGIGAVFGKLLLCQIIFISCFMNMH